MQLIVCPFKDFGLQGRSDVHEILNSNKPGLDPVLVTSV